MRRAELEIGQRVRRVDRSRLEGEVAFVHSDVYAAMTDHDAEVDWGTGMVPETAEHLELIA